MYPSFTFEDVRNGGSADAEPRGDFTLRSGRLPDRPHIGLGQLGAAVGASLAVTEATLRVPVSHVVGVRSRPQMIRVYTGGDIALVQDVRPIRLDRTIGIDPDQAMRALQT